MAYVKNATWQDSPSTATPITAAKLNNIEDGIFAAAATADAAIPKTISGYATDKVPVYNGSDWVAQKITNAQIDAAAAIAVTKLGTAPLVYAYGGAAQTIGSGSWTTITPLATEVLDTDTMHDAVTNSGRLTVKTAGTYLLFAHVGWTASASGGHRLIRFKKDGASIGNQGFSAAPVSATLNGLGATHVLLAAATVAAYFEVEVYQDTGGNLDIVNAHFGAVRISA